MVVNGASTGLVPSKVKNKNTNTKNQKKYIFIDIFWYCMVCGLKGKISKIIIEESRARTPPSLLGIARRIAYANKKYHSG